MGNMPSAPKMATMMVLNIYFVWLMFQQNMGEKWSRRDVPGNWEFFFYFQFAWVTTYSLHPFFSPSFRVIMSAHSKQKTTILNFWTIWSWKSIYSGFLHCYVTRIVSSCYLTHSGISFFHFLLPHFFPDFFFKNHHPIFLKATTLSFEER